MASSDESRLKYRFASKKLLGEPTSSFAQAHAKSTSPQEGICYMPVSKKQLTHIGMGSYKSPPGRGAECSEAGWVPQADA